MMVLVRWFLSGALQLKNLTSTLANCSGLISSACNASAMVQPSSTIISGQFILRKKQCCGSASGSGSLVSVCFWLPGSGFISTWYGSGSGSFFIKQK
jgi:hypothetical protein